MNAGNPTSDGGGVCGLSTDVAYPDSKSPTRGVRQRGIIGSDVQADGPEEIVFRLVLSSPIRHAEILNQGAEVVWLPDRQMNVLLILASAVGNVVSKEALIEAAGMA